MKANLRKYLPLAVLMALFLSLFAFYAIVYPYHFFWHEQNQLFLLDGAWVRQYLGRPAWMACLAGEFLTQFYYYFYAGPAILSAVVTLTAWIGYTALRRASCPLWLSWSLTAIATLWIAGSTMCGECTLSSTLCVTGALAVTALAGRRPLVAGVLAPAVWWLFGYGVLVYAAVAVVGALCKRNRAAISGAALSLALGLLTPLCLTGVYTLRYQQALMYPGASSPRMPEMDVERTLAVDNEYYFGNYWRAAHLALHNAPANKMTACYYYLSQAQLDSLPESLLRFGLRDLGTLNTIGEGTPIPVINMMNDLYFAMGDMTYAERAAMMRNVFSPVNRNARMIKRLAEVNIAAGDSLAAKKYLRLLSKTVAYRRWANSFLDKDGNLAPGLPTAVSAPKDGLRLGDNCRVILTGLLDDDPGNTLALDYLLCTDLLLKDMDNFKADYDRYCMSLGRPRPRDLYQQALMIYLAGTQAAAEEWTRYIHSPQLVGRFQAYSARRGDPAYADTYWYYFDTVK